MRVLYCPLAAIIARLASVAQHLPPLEILNAAVGDSRACGVNKSLGIIDVSYPKTRASGKNSLTIKEECGDCEGVAFSPPARRGFRESRFKAFVVVSTFAGEQGVKPFARKFDMEKT